MTNYLVLMRQGDGNRWFIVGHAEATGPVQARKKVTQDEGEYLVVPVRNATFESVSVQQPPPKATSVLVDVGTYLDVQPTLPVEEEHSVKAPEAA